VDERGIPRFQLLQRFQKQPTAPTLYYVFDVLWTDGGDIIGQTVLERRALLERIIKPVPGIQLGTYVENDGKALFQLVKEKGMEGVIAKRNDSIYRPGRRTSEWLKIKARLQQEFVVGGFTAPKGSRKQLGAVAKQVKKIAVHSATLNTCSDFCKDKSFLFCVTPTGRGSSSNTDSKLRYRIRYASSTSVYDA